MKEANRRVVLINRIRGDFPFGHHTIAEPGVYTAYVNPYGAVAVTASNGEWLGLKPDEFQWLDEPVERSSQ